jgi:hypothetical protein
VVWAGWYQNGSWQGSSQVGAGITPDLFRQGDSLFLVFLGVDSTLWINTADISSGTPTWGNASSVVSFDEMVRNPCVVVDSASGIYVAVTGWRSGKIYLYQSTNRGSSFTEISTPESSGADDAKLALSGSVISLLYRDYAASPLVGLRYYQHSVEPSRIWWTKSTIVDSLTAIGDFDLVSGAAGMQVAFETQGIIRTAKSPDGVTWTLGDTMGSWDFSRTPIWISDSLLAWFENGDSNCDVLPQDSLRFSYDQTDHGTMMASIIAGYDYGSMVGVAPGAELLVAETEFYRFRYPDPDHGYEFQLEEDNYISGLEWAERHGADIISSSLGYSAWYTPNDFDGKTAPVSVAVGLAVERGLVVVTAMGNRDTTQPAELWPNPYIVAPGDAIGAITAGGVEPDLMPWHTPGGGGTGCGPTADGRIKPDLAAMGDSVTVVDPESTDGVYEAASGTSGATALLAGCCALLKEAHPDWSGVQIRDTLFAYGNHHDAPDDTFGHGVPNVFTILTRYPPVKPPIKGDDIEAFPNPYPCQTGKTMYFGLLLHEPPTYLDISILTLSGQLVSVKHIKKIGDQFLTAPGRYLDKGLLGQIGAIWDGKNDQGKAVASGIYYAVLQTSYSRAVRAFALVR